MYVYLKCITFRIFFYIISIPWNREQKKASIKTNQTRKAFDNDDDPSNDDDDENTHLSNKATTKCT